MHILIYQWKAYNYEDILNTLTDLGHTYDCTDFVCKQDDKDDEFEQKICKLLSFHHFDAVFSINYFTVLAKACYQSKIPYLAWNYDSPLISMYNQSVFLPTNYIFTFDKANYKEFKALGVPHLYHLPLAGNPNRMDQVLSTAASTSLPFSETLDISFIGNMYTRNEYDEIKNQLPDYLAGYFDACILAQTKVCGGNIIEPMLTSDILSQLERYFHLEKEVESFSSLELVFSTTILGFKAAQYEREHILNTLSKTHNVALFSNVPTPELPLVHNYGLADYHTTVPFLYRNSKINLNFTIPNIQTGVSLRVYDILSAKGFLLTNYREELLDNFTPNEDLVIFEDENDLLRKVDYYLSHDDERLAIAEHGYHTVSQNHTYHQRIQTILSTL